MYNSIKEVSAREILDSRGNPTIEAKITLSSGKVGVASVPSGASTGSHEAHELRDNDKARYGGKGVLRAVNNVKDIIAPALLGRDVTDQKWIDEKLIALDGSENKSVLGANATLSVSLAAARAAANGVGIEMHEYLSTKWKGRAPTPMFNLLNGGAHASNNVDIQEFMVVPHGLSLPDAIRAGSEIYHTLGSLLKQRNLSTAVGDEGGYAPNLTSDEEAIELLCKAITTAGYKHSDVGLAIDVAASEWWHEGKYHLPKRNKVTSNRDLIEYYSALCEKYPIISIEDGLAEDDFDGWRMLTEAIGKYTMLVGDDLFVTNEKRLRQGISLGIGNAILIKPNQIGTLTEVMQVISLAREANYKVIISHRSGETCDSSIADIAVATGAHFIKAGAPCRGERVAKYNRLTEITQ